MKGKRDASHTDKKEKQVRGTIRHVNGQATQWMQAHTQTYMESTICTLVLSKVLYDFFRQILLTSSQSPIRTISDDDTEKKITYLPRWLCNGSVGRSLVKLWHRPQDYDLAPP